MRIAAQVLLAYALLLVFGCVWRFVPGWRAVPDVVALCAVYLGLTARQRLMTPTLGAVILGYLGDLLLGTPRGLLALIAGLICIFGHLIHRRLIVRGWMVTVVLATFTGLIAGVLSLMIRALAGLVPAGVGADLGMLVRSALLTGLAGPLVFRLCRIIDARFARTHREREAAIEGLAP